MSRPDVVSVCPDKEQTPDSTVRICDEDKTPESVVRICEDECANLAPLTLQGSTTPSNGSEYQAGGGKPPYIYSVTGGASMANDGATGTIGDLANGCGAGQVSVVDACGNRASIAIRYPSGQWVLVAYENVECGNFETNTFTKTHTSGATQIRIEAVTGGSGYVYPCGESDCFEFPVTFFWGTGDGCYKSEHVRTYEWQCP